MWPGPLRGQSLLRVRLPGTGFVTALSHLGCGVLSSCWGPSFLSRALGRGTSLPNLPGAVGFPGMWGCQSGHQKSSGWTRSWSPSPGRQAVFTSLPVVTSHFPLRSKWNRFLSSAMVHGHQSTSCATPSSVPPLPPNAGGRPPTSSPAAGSNSTPGVVPRGPLPWATGLPKRPTISPDVGRARARAGPALPRVTQ